MVCTAIKQMSSPGTRSAISLSSLRPRVLKVFLCSLLSLLLLFSKSRSSPPVKFAVLHLCSLTVELITMCTQAQLPVSVLYVGRSSVCTLQ